MTGETITTADPQPLASVLLVDDRRDKLLAIQTALEPLGHRLVGVTSGQDALRQLLVEDFAVVLLDIEMPGLDGIETARAIRQRDRTRHLPILFLTGHAPDHPKVDAAYGMGAVDVVFAPFKGAVLRAKLGQLVELHRLRAEADEHRRMSETALRSVIDNAPLIVWSVDQHGIYRQSEGRGLAAIGFRPHQVVGQSHFEVCRDDPAAIDCVRRALAGESFRDEAQIAGRWFETSYVPLRDAAGGILGVAGVSTDISERRLAEQALREREQRLRWLLEHTMEVVWRFDLDQPVPVVLPPEGQIDGFYRHGRLSECNEAMARTYGYPSAAAMSGLPLGTLMPQAEARNIEFLKEFIASGYRLVDAESVEVGADGATRYMLNSLVGVIRDGALHSAWGTSRDITGRREAEEALRLHSLVLGRMQEGVSVTDDQGMIVYTNAAEDAMFGYGPGELVGQHVSVQNDLPPEENQRLVRRVIDELTSTGSWSGEWPNRRKDGTGFITISRITTFERSGRRFFVCVQSDVTAEKRRVQELKDSEDRFRQLADSMLQIVWTAEPDGRIDYYNRQWYDCTGQAPGSEDWRLAVHPDDVPRCLERWQRSVATGEVYEVECRYRHHASGAYRWHLSRARPIRDAVGAIQRWFGTSTDIDDTKRATEALREGEAHTRAIIDSALDAVITIDAAGLITDWNPRAETTFGWTRAEAIGRRLADLIIPQRDRLAHARGIERYLATGVEAILNRRIELTALRRDGEEFPVELSIVPTRIGGRVMFCGFLRDITKRKRTEEQLRGRERLLTLVTDALPALVSYVDPDRRYRFVNRPYSDWFDLSREQMLGKSIPELVGDEAYSHVRPKVEGALAGQPMAFEGLVPYRGGPRHILAQYMPDIDEAGQVRGFVSLIQDISERRRAEDREHLLAEATAALGASLDIEAGLRALAAIAVPGLADRCVIELVGDDGGLRTVAARQRGSDEAIQPDGPARLRPPDDLSLSVVASGCARIFDPLPEALVSHKPEDPAAAGGLAPGMRACALLPLRARDRVLGVMTLAHAAPGRLAGADLALAEELARRASIALDNALLYQAERAARALAAEKAEALARSNAELEQFAYVASHDLQEPLRMVTQYLGLLDRRLGVKLEAREREYLQHAVDGGGRMHLLIDDLLQFSRIGRSGGDQARAVDLERALEEAIENLRGRIEQGGGLVTHDPLPMVHGEKVQLTQVLQNLIANALKFHGPQPPRVHLATRDAGDAWEIAVSDSGIGIAPQHQERIFEVFQRLHTRQDYPGTGIGLSICKKIVERHGGRIWVESQAGQGAVFRFTVPKAKAATPAG